MPALDLSGHFLAINVAARASILLRRVGLKLFMVLRILVAIAISFPFHTSEMGIKARVSLADQLIVEALLAPS